MHCSYLRGMKKITLVTFSSIVSLWTLLVYNIPFFHYVAQNSESSFGGKLFLITSLVIVMLVLNFMLTYLAMWLLRMVGRILLAVFSVINATAFYFIFTYHAIIDATTIENVFNTRYVEASAFFNGWMVLLILALGVLPALYCIFQPIILGSAKKMGAYCGASLVVILVVAALNISQTLWISQHDTELGGLLQPWSYVVNIGRVISSQHDEKAEEIKLPDGKITDHEKAVVVLVIGESARKANFQLYGYKRDTNPLLSKQKELKVFQANYNWGEPPIHIDEYLTDQELSKLYPDVDRRYDGLLFTGLRERIMSSKKDKVLIILHTSTSHGPRYVDKYPKEFEVYKPVANSIEEGEKHINLLVNAYDNTIRYTDYLLDNLIQTLRQMDNWKSAMIFISDHGESLGENKMFMHGLPMKLAPKVQYEIPFLVWTSDGFRTYKPAGPLPAVLDQHFVFHSVLNLLSIQSPAYNKEFDVFE